MPWEKISDLGLDVSGRKFIFFSLIRIFYKQKSLTADEVMKRIECYAKRVELEQLKMRVDYLKLDIPRIEVDIE